MKQQKFTLSIAMFLLPFCAFAHGEEVLLPLFIQFASILIFIIVLTSLKIKVAKKLVLFVIYFLTLSSILCISWNVPYRQNRTVLDLSWTLGPATTTLIAFLIFRLRDKDRMRNISWVRINTANSVFIKLWRDVRHSTINRYFAFVVNWTWRFQMPQLHKYLNVRLWKNYWFF